MKNWLLLIVFGVFISGCKLPETPEGMTETDILLSSNPWELEKFTNTQGQQIHEGGLESGARLLFGLVFEFRANKEVRGRDKVSQTVVNRGSWALSEDQKTIEIKITGLDDDFALLNIAKGTMTLQAKNENRLAGIGPEINLVFKEYKGL